MSMKVCKRNGNFEEVSFDKILFRMKRLIGGENGDDRFDFLKGVDPYRITQKVIENIYDNINTYELDMYAADYALDLSIEEPDYAILSLRLVMSNVHKSKSASSFSEMTDLLHKQNIINNDYYRFVKKEKALLNNAVVSFRDYHLDVFGYKTLEKSYLYKVTLDDKLIQETPQHLFMRVAVAMWYSSDSPHKLQYILKTYDFISKKFFTHASPTLFNAGTKKQQLSSCFLMGTHDSIDGIFKTISDAAKISKWAGGIGLHISNIRAKNSLIRGTRGVSSGILQMMKQYDALCVYVNQGGKRNGSIAIYLEPHHADVIDFLRVKNNITDVDKACRNLFTALWVSDYFMECVKNDTDWYLMCPDMCPGLTDVYGQDYKNLYKEYVSQGKYIEKVRAYDIWTEFLRAQSLAGMPYILFKDAINEKSNQKNIGVIKGSNLCAEICLVSDDSNYSVCNLASICLSKCISNGAFDFKHLETMTRQIVRNLNRVIDLNYYPTKETKKTNTENRPIGIGVQGLANVFYSLGMSFESLEAKELNKKIFEHIQFSALSESCLISQETDKTYDMYPDSPISEGIFQHNMWGIDCESQLECDWESLRRKIKEFGIYNSVVTCCMPTASTSQIMGNFESFEPITSNMFTRNTLSGNHIVINQYLVDDLKKLGLWDSKMSQLIQLNSGSIQSIDVIPDNIKTLYKTVWEIPQKVLIDLAIDRAPFIDQTQSMNLYVATPTVGKLTSMYFYCWEKGLKTGGYYLRSQSSSKPIKFTIDECTSCSA